LERFNHVIPAAHAPPGDDRSDAQLARATRGGDMTALAELYRRFGLALMGVAYRLLASREAAEDVLHDVFVGLPEALRKYEERGRLEAWLKQVTARFALSVLRRAQTGCRLESAPETPVAPHPATTITLHSAVAALSPSLRAVLVLKEIEGFTHAEIAAMLGISKGASEVRLHRALVALRAALTEGEESG
jgi:RNA polymerase sigma factor (sigma-70 family)